LLVARRGVDADVVGTASGARPSATADLVMVDRRPTEVEACPATTKWRHVRPPLSGGMSGHHLEIVPLSRHRWIIRYEGDPVALSEHAAQTQKTHGWLTGATEAAAVAAATHPSSGSPGDRWRARPRPLPAAGRGPRRSRTGVTPRSCGTRDALLADGHGWRPRPRGPGGSGRGPLPGHAPGARAAVPRAHQQLIAHHAGPLGAPAIDRPTPGSARCGSPVVGQRPQRRQASRRAPREIGRSVARRSPLGARTASL
jgi:hypothetical protein